MSLAFLFPLPSFSLPLLVKAGPTTLRAHPLQALSAGRGQKQPNPGAWRQTRGVYGKQAKTVVWTYSVV